MKDTNLLDNITQNTNGNSNSKDNLSSGTNILESNNINSINNLANQVNQPAEPSAEPLKDNLVNNLDSSPKIITANDMIDENKNTKNTSPINQSPYNQTTLKNNLSNISLKSENNFESNSQISNVKLSLLINKAKDLLLNFIFPIVNIALIIALILLYLYPGSIKFLNDKSTLEENLTTIRVLDVKLKKLLDISYLQSTFDNYYSIVENALVSSQQVPELLTVIDSIAKNSGLSVNRLSYSLSQNLDSDNSYSNVDVSLTVAGTLNQLLTFFELSENAIRVYNIESFRFSFNQELQLFEVSFLIQSPYLEVNSLAVTDDAINLNIDDPEFASLINKLESMTYYNPNELESVEPILTEDVATEEIIIENEQTSEVPVEDTQVTNAQIEDTNLDIVQE